jgi:23S rRNA maturation mini-RNase III
MGEAIGRSSLAMAAFTDPALALAFVKALEQREEYREILESLEQRTKRVRQRQDEAKAHQRNVRTGKVRKAPVTKKD